MDELCKEKILWILEMLGSSYMSGFFAFMNCMENRATYSVKAETFAIQVFLWSSNRQ